MGMSIGICKDILEYTEIYGDYLILVGGNEFGYRFSYICIPDNHMYYGKHFRDVNIDTPRPLTHSRSIFELFRNHLVSKSPEFSKNIVRKFVKRGKYLNYWCFGVSFNSLDDLPDKNLVLKLSSGCRGVAKYPGSGKVQYVGDVVMLSRQIVDLMKKDQQMWRLTEA